MVLAHLYLFMAKDKLSGILLLSNPKSIIDKMPSQKATVGDIEIAYKQLGEVVLSLLF